MTDTFDAIVIGAGEAGGEVANRAIAAGQRVAMIYRNPFGSTCLNIGCVPSKFMIHRANVAQVARTAGRFHVETSAPRVDLAGIVREKDALIARNRAAALQGAQETECLTLREGEAHFTAPHELVAAGDTLRADHIFIATELRPHMPPITGIDRVPALTNESLMELTALPEHLVIVGGGYIACEFGQAFRRYGSDVTIIQNAAHLCPREEPEVSTVLEQALAAEGIDLALGHTAVRVDPEADGVRVTARAKDGSERVVTGTHLLVAAGRQPNTDTLGLPAAGVATDAHGFVRVDASLRTTASSIWAIGDVNGQQPFTRACACEEAKVAYANACEGAGLTMPRRFLGHAIFTNPEIGSVGLTEAEARQEGYEVATGLMAFDQVEKAQLIGETRGLIKYVVDRPTHRLLGCHVIGPDGANLIYAATAVLRHGGSLDEIALAIGIFPTLIEGMEGAALNRLRDVAPDKVAGPLVTVPLTHDGAGR